MAFKPAFCSVCQATPGVSTVIRITFEDIDKYVPLLQIKSLGLFSFQMMYPKIRPNSFKKKIPAQFIGMTPDSRKKDLEASTRTATALLHMTCQGSAVSNTIIRLCRGAVKKIPRQNGKKQQREGGLSQ